MTTTKPTAKAAAANETPPIDDNDDDNQTILWNKDSKWFSLFCHHEFTTYVASQPTSFQNVTHHHHHLNTNPFHHASLTNHHDIWIPHVLIFTYRRNLLEMPMYLSEGELDNQMRHVQELIRQAEILKQGAAAAAEAAAVGPNGPLHCPPPF
ncbi:hypothetical protein ACA910_004701 [Epithemia clementina (nom. ined.)]